MGARSSQSRGPGLNKTDGHLLEYFRQNFGAGGGGTQFVPPPPQGIQATGGIINDYSVGSDLYRAHIFTSSGAFNVTGLFSNDPDLPDTVDYLVVGGGGGGGYAQQGDGGGGGGGAGAVRYATTQFSICSTISNRDWCWWKWSKGIKFSRISRHK